MKKPIFEIKNITVAVEEKEVVKDLSLAIGKGEIHVLMGSNGSGKTSLCYAALGNPLYHITKGTIGLKGKNITALPTEERVRQGLFLSFQDPPEIGGVGLSSFLRAMAKKHTKDPFGTMERVHNIARALRVEDTFMNRCLNEGFSGGEKKKSEILQLTAAAPVVALIDEIDAGLDIDSLHTVSATIKKMAKNGTGILLITHSTKLFTFLKPNRVHIISNGTITASGGSSLLKKIEKTGFRTNK